MSSISLKHTLTVVFATAFTLSCAALPRPPELINMDGLMKDEAQLAKAGQAEDIFKRAQTYYQEAVKKYDKGNEEGASYFAIMAELTFKTALEESASKAAEARIASAKESQEAASQAKENDELRHSKYTKRVARMEKIIALQQSLDSEKKTSRSEKKKLQNDLKVAKKQQEQQLAKEHLEQEVRSLLAVVDGKIKTAAALKAKAVDAENVTAAEQLYMQAERAINGNDFDTARKHIAGADKAVTGAIKKARAAFAEQSKELNFLAQREQLFKATTALGADDVSKKEQGVMITLHEMFAPGKTELRTERVELLKKIAAVAKKYTDYPVLIEGYTDSRGDQARNLALSTSRSQAVLDFFIQQEKLDINRTKAAGYGEANPIADNSTSAGRAKNRRIQVLFLFP